MSLAQRLKGRWQQAKIAPATQKAMPEAEIIQAPAAPSAARPARQISINLPSIRPPANLASWFVLALACGLFYISVQATDIFIHELFASPSWWYAWAVQIGLSAIERYLFAGVRNAVTIGALLVDSFLNAAGMFIKLLPAFFRTSVWAMLASGLGLSGTLSGFSLFVASVILGSMVAYTNDKLFSLATAARG